MIVGKLEDNPASLFWGAFSWAKIAVSFRFRVILVVSSSPIVELGDRVPKHHKKHEDIFAIFLSTRPLSWCVFFLKVTGSKQDSTLNKSIQLIILGKLSLYSCFLYQPEKKPSHFTRVLWNPQPTMDSEFVILDKPRDDAPIRYTLELPPQPRMPVTSRTSPFFNSESQPKPSFVTGILGGG